MGNKILGKHSPSGFNQDQIAYLQEKFQLLCNQQGFLDQAKFGDAFKCTINESRQAFKFIDFTGTGSVDFYQFKCAAANFCLSDISDTSEMIFSIYSKSNDRLSLNDLYIFTKTIYLFNDFVDQRNPLSEEAIKVFNQESKAKLSGDEVRQLQGKRKEIQQLNKKKMKKWDYDQTGQLSKSQFHNVLTKDPDFKLWMYNMGFISKGKYLCQGEQQYDSDIENQTQRYNINIDERQERIKHGIQHNLNQEEDMLFGQVHDQGDQAGCAPPWKKTAEYMEPDGYDKKQALPAPDSQLQMEHVYGYRCHDTRENLKYGPNGQIIYHTAAIGINLNASTKKQVFNLDHQDDITCIDVHQNTAVSGEMGSKPLLVVWDINTCQSLFMFKGQLKKSIGNVCFSHDGKKIAANSLDDDHCIAIYDIEKAAKLKQQIKSKQTALIASGKGSKSVIFSLKFSPSGDTLVAGCYRQILFFNINKGIRAKKGIFGKATPMTTLSMCYNGNDLISGMMNGNLLIWKGNSCASIIMGHNQSVGALAPRKNRPGVISGSKSGIVKIWSSDMKEQKEIDLVKILSSNMLKIIALSHNKAGKLLCGLRGGQIFQVNTQVNQQPKLLMQGHYNYELWGLCTHPKHSQFYTVGQDKLLMHWDTAKWKLLKKKTLQSIGKFVDISPDGLTLAVGMKNGMVQIMKQKDFEKITEIKFHKNPDKQICSLVKYSPNGNILAVGYAPPISKVYLFNTKDYKSKHICKGSPSRIFQLDYSQSSQEIQVNNTSYQILFYNAVSGEQIRSGSTLKNQVWATHTCGMSWRTKGIWPPCSDGTDINSVDRSKNQTIIATGDDFSKVKLFRNPASQDRQAFNSYKGHSSHITAVRFTYNDNYLISTGGAQKSIIQWKFIWAQKQIQLVQVQEQKQDQEQEKGEEDALFQQAQDEGDQALAVKPFLGQVLASTPDWYKKNPKRDNKLPIQQLKLIQAYGIRNQYIKDQVRNQCKYAKNKDWVVFPTACLGVVMNKKTRDQSFFNVHKEDIVSFGIDSSGTIAATGQMAQRIKNKRQKIVDLYVWDVQTKQVYARFNNFHVAAIVLVSFSPDGTRILTAGQDDNNSIAVYDWKTQVMLWTGKTSRGKVNASAWKSNDQYMTCGNTQVRFWTKAKGRMGKLSGKWQAMFSCLYYKNAYITGSGNGSLFFWVGSSAGKGLKAHQGKVQCLHSMQNGILSGGDDGYIKQWIVKGGSLSQVRIVFDMSKATIYDPGVLSIDSYKSNLLIVTKSSQIYEIVDKDIGCIMKSHYQKQLWGLCTSPNDYRFVTGGDDKTIRMWNIPQKKMIQGSEVYDEQIRAIDWNKNLKQIVVGDGKGHLFLLDQNLNKLHQYTSRIEKGKKVQSNYWIEDIKFSPDGGLVAFGAHGTIGSVQIVQLMDGKFQDSKIIKNVGSSAVLHLDWNLQSTMLVANSQDYFLKFLSIAALNNVASSGCKDMEFASWTCKLGFPVQGIWQGVDFTDINTVDRSKSQTFLATGNDDQTIRLFNYPVVVDKQVNKQFYGHSSHVTRVRFSHDDNYLVSCGGNDRTVIVWQVLGMQKFKKHLLSFASKKSKVMNANQEEQQQDQFDEEDLDIDFPSSKIQKEQEKTMDQNQFFQTEEDDGDQFMAIKPWIGAIRAPDSLIGYDPKTSHLPPQISIQLEYCHGYRTKDCRNNLKYLQGEQNIVYHAAALGIVHSIKDNKQRFFNKHIDDIISMALHPNKRYVATGEIGPKPNLYLWDAYSMDVIHHWKAPIKKGISALAFSKTGRYIAAAAIDDNHYVCVLNAQNGDIIAVEKGGRDVILQIGWSSDDTFITIGIKHFKQWTFGGSLKGKNGSFGKNSNQICSISIDQQNVLTGSGTGFLYKWQGTSIIKAVKLHQKPLEAISAQKNVLLTGGKDKRICVINRTTIQLICQFDMTKFLAVSRCPNIRALDLNDDSTRLLVGTMGSQVYEMRVEDPKFQKKNALALDKTIVQSHYAPNMKWLNEVWGLAMSNDGKSYYTCSDDATLRLWDIQKKKMVASASLNYKKQACGKPDYEKHRKFQLKPDIKTKDYQDSAKGRCLAVCPKDGCIVVGCRDGSLRVFDKDLVPIKFFKAAQKQISDMKFSPDGTMLSVGSHNSKIYVYDYDGSKFRLKYRPIKKHSSYITHIDFSMDGNCIHSTCGAYQLLFFQLNMGKQLTSGASSLKNQKWHTWTATLGWPVQGIWPECTDGTHINSVHRSNETIDGTQFSYHLLATGDDWGKLRILRYPSIKKSSKGVQGKGHSSHVTQVRWTQDDKRVVTTGGQDQCVMQWLIHKQK